MWIYYTKEGLVQQINSIEDIPENALGFVYLLTITDLDGNIRKYIGKKNIYSERTKPLGKKELEALTDKRRSKKKKIVTESDWLKYQSSCKPLIECIQNGCKVEKVILEFTFSKRELTYKEVWWMFKYNVLESDEWYNENILSIFYKGNLK